MEKSDRELGMGRDITMAGADAYTHVAIDEAFRAVEELV